MANFNYSAKRKTGASVSGTIEAPSREAALSLLKEQDLIVVGLVERTFVHKIEQILHNLAKVKSKEVVFFSRQLSVMLEANVPLVRALRVLVKQTNNAYLKIVISDIAEEVDGGAKLSASLARYPKIFNNFFVHMVRAGETTGRLDQVLVYLADQLEHDYALNGRIKGAMIYPAFIFSVLAVMGFAMMVFVVPRFVSIFETAKITLPLSTRILIAVSGYFVNYWWLIIILIIIFIVSFLLFIKSSFGRYYFDVLKIKVPVIGPINWKTAMVRMSRSLSSLLASGVPVTKSLVIVSDIVGNGVYKKIFLETSGEVEVGKTISSVFIKHKEVPLLITHMINVGEETGRLDTVLTKVGNFYEAETDVSIKALVSLIEPIILVLMGLVAGGLVVSILMPMYNLTESFT